MDQPPASGEPPSLVRAPHSGLVTRGSKALPQEKDFSKAAVIFPPVSRKLLSCLQLEERDAWFCASPFTWAPTMDVPLKRLCVSWAIKEGTFLFVFCLCLSRSLFFFLSDHLKLIVRKKAHERFRLDRSHNTFRNVNFSCFHENTVRSHFRGQWWR